MLKLIENFFTHKDFLGGLDLPGRLFSPLHIIVSVCLLAAVVDLAVVVSKKIRGLAQTYSYGSLGVFRDI